MPLKVSPREACSGSIGGLDAYKGLSSPRPSFLAQPLCPMFSTLKIPLTTLMETPANLPALNHTFGTFLLGTFLGLMLVPSPQNSRHASLPTSSLRLYGIFLYQVNEYCRLYTNDCAVLKTMVRGPSPSAESLHEVTLSSGRGDAVSASNARIAYWLIWPCVDSFKHSLVFSTPTRGEFQVARSPAHKEQRLTLT